MPKLCFSLRVEPVVGTDIETAIADAWQVCITWGFASVKFDFNGKEFEVFKCGEAFEIQDNKLIALWKYLPVSFSWKRLIGKQTS